MFLNAIETCLILRSARRRVSKDARQLFGSFASIFSHATSRGWWRRSDRVYLVDAYP